MFFIAMIRNNRYLFQPTFDSILFLHVKFMRMRNSI